MKRRIALLLGATAMTVGSVAGVSITTATPAAAQTQSPLAAVGYLISCFTGPLLSGQFAQFAPCLQSGVRQLLSSVLILPPVFQPPTNSAAPPASDNGTNAPRLNLPSNIRESLASLPPALQTNPVADVPTITAPVRQLIPTLSPSRGLTTTAPKLPSASALTSKLPKVPTAAPISFLNISESEAKSAGSPVSGADMLTLLGLGAVGAAGVTAAMRRRAAAQ